MTPRPRNLLFHTSERDFARTVIELAELRGWRVYRTWNSLHSPKGWPDLALVHDRPPRLVFAELKTERGKLTEPQRETLDLLAAVPGVIVAECWRPSSWARIEAVLH